MPPTDRPLWQLLLDLKTAVQPKRPLSCTECFSVLEYLAKSLNEATPAKRQALLQQATRQHLIACPDCQTHYQARLAEFEQLFTQQTADN